MNLVVSIVLLIDKKGVIKENGLINRLYYDILIILIGYLGIMSLFYLNCKVIEIKRFG